MSHAQIHGAGIVQATSKSWGILKARLSNPDSKDKTVEIKVLPALNSFNDFNVFSEKVTIPAKSEITYLSPIFMDSNHSFKVQMFAGGRELSSAKAELQLLPKKTSLSVVINDSDKNHFYLTKKIPAFKETVLTPTTNSRALPDNWLVLKELDSIIIIDPDYSQINSEQYQSIINYVNQGGTLIFAGPRGVLDAVNTPLASLLPVSPVRITTEGEFTGLNTIIPNSASQIAKAAPVLVSYPKGNGITIAGTEQFPLIRWKKVGLGSVRFIAFTPNEESVKNANFAAKIIRKLIPIKKEAKRAQSYAGFQKYLDNMTGIKIPTIGFIQIIFVIYFIVLLATALICNYTNRSNTLWVALSCVSILFAAAIVLKSTSSGLSGETIISEIKISVPSSEATTSRSLFSAFSGGDNTLQLNSTVSQASFSAFPQSTPESIGARRITRNRKSNKARIAKSFLVTRENGHSSLSSHKLRSNTPLQFQSLGAGEATNIGSYPVIDLTSGSYKFTPWNLPKEIACTKAFLALPSTVIPLEINNGVVSIPDSPQPLSKSLLAEEFLTHTTEARPYVGLICDSKPDSLQLPEQVQYNGTELYVIPAQIQAGKGSLTISQNLLKFDQNNLTAQAILANNTAPIITRGQGRHKLNVALPEALSCISPEEISVSFNYNTTNKEFEVVPALSRGRQHVWTRQKEPGLFVFNKNQINRVFENNSASFEITFHEKLKNNKRNKTRKNITWTPQKFSISLKGRLPDGMAPLKY